MNGDNSGVFFAVFVDDRAAMIWRAVIDNYDFDIFERLRQNTV